ncbi:DNA internalization-related competence protein ComEC/Rec2 [Chitinimonas arctica]|uniref:DNA internalization-related competence protein ComEC/Rec2 n=1 Tax=Chitinimonas arctica TaxID=2594795 RepID=A0A516SD39_9NEIS|nr:DNA internalization-related competence protein ComEC/Rec2 [Chitinimonas arctica]QDQ26061.1 DNA internalization-related competence protein ComEC/Rec2 [Chitinimonas arctica]
MRLAIFAFVLGVVWLQCQPGLPGGGIWLPATILPVVAYALRGRSALAGYAALLSCLLVGAAYAGWRAESRLAGWLPHTLENHPILVTGVITGLPQSTPFGQHFRLATEHPPRGTPSLLLLSDYARPASDWRPGQRWRLTVKLKRPHGSINPGGYDYEAWLLAEGIGASGSVDRRARVALDAFVPTPVHLLHAARAWLARRIRHALGGRPYAEVIVALVIGEQAGITPDQWTLFRATGITHLVSISGLHITLVAGLLGGLAGWLWRRSARLCLLQPARKVALLAGVLAALAYSLLAGFSVPTQRTFFMLTVAAVALLSMRSLAVADIWTLALGLTVGFDPWAVLSAGFWLSYLTVGAMLWALAGSAGEPQGWRAKLYLWGQVQWAATLGSLPLLLALFQQFPLSSPLANAVAIPLVSSVATPLALAGSLEPSGWLLYLAEWVLQFAFRLITPLAAATTLWSQAAPAYWSMVPAAVGVAVLLLPRGVPARLLAGMLLLPVLLPRLPVLPAGSYRVTIFDVGQGLSVLLQTAGHAMLFDSGTASGGGRVLPGALRAAGVRHLDLLLLSHDDSDHTGGASAVLAEVDVAGLRGVPPHRETLPAGFRLPPRAPCRAGESWSWDGVHFDMLHPPARQRAAASDNASSCVLRVQGSGGRLLLPADIGRPEEAALLTKAPSGNPGAQLRADVLVMPHHGSAGSSSTDFVAAVSPRLAVATVGYLNGFRHPRPDVLKRYAAQGSTVWRTDLDGAVRIEFGPPGWQAERWRAAHRRYWFEVEDDSRIEATTTLPVPR